MGDLNLNLEELQTLTRRILVAHGTSDGNAEQVATALVLAEADGQKGHGASRIPSYAAQARSGKVDGHATPVSEQVAKSALRIDARSGFAYPALNLALDGLAALAEKAAVHRARISVRVDRRHPEIRIALERTDVEARPGNGSGHFLEDAQLVGLHIRQRGLGPILVLLDA